MVASFLAGPLQAAVWVVALVIDYGVAYVRGVAGFQIHPDHFVDRHRDIVIIARGESVSAMGPELGNDVLELPPESIVAAFLGIILAAGLAWLYFDHVTLAMEENLVTADPHVRARLARDTYSYLHYPIVAGIIFVAFGLKKTVAHPQVPLETIPAVALCVGGALYLFGDVAARLRDVGIISKPGLVVAILAFVIIPEILEVPSLTALV